ncbi:MAG: cytochrome P450 [Solirubrobacteraceae bacterium]
MTLTTAPSSPIDLWTPEIMAEPYPAYRELRDLAPVVYLENFDLWAIGRYAQVREVLGHWERFTSTQGTALSAQLNELILGTILSVDPPLHDQMRSVLAEQLTPRAIAGLTGEVEARAEALVERVVAMGSFDAVSDLAEPLPVELVAHLIGLPEDKWEPLLDLADSIFTVYGPWNELTQANLEGANAFYAYCAEEAAREKLCPGSWGAAIYEAADAGVIPHEQTTNLMASYVGAGMDTTIAGIAVAVKLFAENPDQWDLLRAEPDLMRQTFSEILRLEGPVQSFSRVTVDDWDADGIEVPAGARLLVLYASANRDERKWPDPERFDIRRNPIDHLGFGYGLHACAGQALARLEIHAVLGALARRVARFEIGEPVMRPNNILRTLKSLPVSVVPA